MMAIACSLCDPRDATVIANTWPGQGLLGR